MFYLFGFSSYTYRSWWFEVKRLSDTFQTSNHVKFTQKVKVGQEQQSHLGCRRGRVEAWKVFTEISVTQYKDFVAQTSCPS